jgi:hypothetical protein
LIPAVPLKAAKTFDRWRGPFSPALLLLGPARSEHKPRAHRRVDDLVAERCAREIVEAVAGNVQGRAKLIKYNNNAIQKDSASISMNIKCNA